MDTLALAIVGEIDIDAPVVSRALTPADLAKLSQVRGNQKPIPLTRRMTMRHHALARCVADGMTDFEAAATTGYDRSYISILKSDPAFKELVNFYVGKKEEKYVDFHERLARLGVDSLDELHNRLEEDPDQFSPGQLLEITKVIADRTGHGPSQTTNHNVSINASLTLRTARERLAKIDADKVIEENLDKARALDAKYTVVEPSDG